ncbi:toll-like receptor 1 [Genypterus blacodes]|uniref:toll-like receptor 1 n=1 Tax=Genypterus blacodes TaxID=154954 RepID=UPI003F76A38C
MRLLSAVFWAAAMLMVQHGTSSIIIKDLSHRNLSSVPRDLPETVESLDLSCNHIHQLHHGDFKNTPHLGFLNLSWNALESIDPETFRDTPLLEYLDLSHNRMQNLLHQQYLFYTKNLLKLNLAYNLFSTMTLGRDFGSLSKLEELSLGAKNISVGDFKNISAVHFRTLAIYLEDDGGYEVGSLEEVTAQRLQIAFTNNQMDLNIVADGLSFFDELELMGLTDHYTHLSKQLRERQEIHTSHIYISNISIKWDDLTDYVKAVLSSSITNLAATDLAMTKLPRHDTDVSQTTNLNTFLMRRASVNSFFFSQESVYNFFINMPVESLAIVDTSIIHMTCPKLQSQTAQLDFSNCALADSIFSRVEGQDTLECENLANVKTLILMGNNLKNLQLVSIRIQYMMSLQHLDLSLNSLTYNGLVGCAWPHNVSHMNLSFNGLTESIFKCLPNRTKILDLKNNQVSMVPSFVLKLNYLLELDLSANRLRDLPVCHGFPGLNRLLLRANSLHAPSVKNLDSCPHLQILDASHNPFICTCTVRGFINLSLKSKQSNSDHTGIDLLRWPEGYICTYPEAKRNFTLKDISIPEISCNVGLLAATILGPAVFVIIAMVTLCHRLDVPWYIGMIWQWTRAKHRARTSQIRPEDLVGVEFHAFVSYSQHDAEWIKNTLLPNLEGPAGLRICHHEKNFMAGKTIIGNIISCVEKSRRSLFVLSAHFVKSDWCHYELYFATHQRLARGSDSVVLVLLEPLPQYLIPSKYYQLKAMMSRHTYLEWPQDRAKHRLFWANLRAALQEDLPHARRNEE